VTVTSEAGSLNDRKPGDAHTLLRAHRFEAELLNAGSPPSSVMNVRPASDGRCQRDNVHCT
jgi:hypothetical protein